MNPIYEQALGEYTKYGRYATLEADVQEYASSPNGYVWLSPSCIIIAADWSPDDTWYVHFACGQGCMAEFFRLAPFPRAYVAIARPAKGRFSLNYHNYERVRRLCTTSSSTLISHSGATSAAQAQVAHHQSQSRLPLQMPPAVSQSRGQPPAADMAPPS